MATLSRSKRVDFIADRYPVHIIKNIEREKRSEGGKFLVNSSVFLPQQWKKFLSSGENKEELTKCLFKAWRKANPKMLNGVEVFITHENECRKFIESANAMICSNIEELTCDHEEADTRIVLTFSKKVTVQLYL